jgi:hypothetical protein
MCNFIWASSYQQSSSRISGGDTGSDVTGSDPDRDWRYRKSRDCNRFPRFFLTIVVVQNVSLRMIDMATGSDRRGSIVRVRACATGSCAISALVGSFHRKWRHQTWPRRASPGLNQWYDVIKTFNFPVFFQTPAFELQRYLCFFHIFHIFSLFNLLFFHIFHIFSQFNLPFFHIVHIFSLFNLLFFPYCPYHFTIFFCIFHIISLFNLLFFRIFNIFSLFNSRFFHIFSLSSLPFFHIVQIFSLFNLLFFHNFHILSLFNLGFFHIFHIFMFNVDRFCCILMVIVIIWMKESESERAQCLKWTVAQSPNATNILFGRPKAAPN